jgi:hypothetical protein
MSYGWYVRNGAGKFLCLKASRGYHGLGLCIHWEDSRGNADRFATWEHGRDFLAWLYSAPEPILATDSSLHLIDYAEHLPAPPDAERRTVRTAQEVREDALAEDKAREAIRRANWTIKPAVAAIMLTCVEVERWISATRTMLDVLTRGHA